MRRLAVISLVLGSVAVLGCAPPTGNPDESVEEAQNPIAYGTSDTMHSAVVSLLTDAGGGAYSECSGSIVKVSGSTGYVLTAAHCCDMGSPSIVIQANDYGPYASQIFNSNPNPPVYRVIAGSAYWDAQYDGYSHDFCMLKFSGATANTPVLALPTGADGLTLGTQIEHVGFGRTDTNNNNSQRRHGTNTANVTVNSSVIQYSQGNGTPGPCEGDSGGPTLIPAGAAQSSQTVVGVTSWGNSSNCAGASQGTSSRVSSEIGAGKFITSYLNDSPIGNPAGESGGDCGSCQQATLQQGGACSSTYNACVNNSACSNLLTCLSNCQDQTCADNCWNSAGTTAQDLYNNIIGCICNTGCATECATECGGSTGNCGLESTDATCNACLTSSCCSEGAACANNQTCLDCITGSTTTGCSSNAAYNDFASCLTDNCATECGISTSSSTTTTTTTTSTTTTATTSATTTAETTSNGSGGSTENGSGGSGSGGAPPASNDGGSGTADGDGGDGGDDGDDEGCGCALPGSAENNSAALGLLGLAALVTAASRRRRAHAST